LAARVRELRCDRCQRSYPLLPRNILELLPLRPIVFPGETGLAAYREGYLREFSRPPEIRTGAKAWGAPEDLSQESVQLRERQAREVFQFLRDERRESELIFCDLSGGAGHCTFPAAQKHRLVFHCDLSIDALAYASAKAAANRFENIIFLHTDYFQPPFRNTIDRLVCLDTLIRGPWHEARLLRSIQTVLTSTGIAVVDFHYWWHNPLRRVGLFPDNFSGNKSYTRKELKSLLASSGIGQFQTQAFVQEVDPLRPTGKILSRILPPTRLMVRLAGTSSHDKPTSASREAP